MKSLRWIKSHGDCVMIGNQLSPVSFDHTPVRHQELRVIAVNRLDGLITHRFPLDRYKEAFRLAGEKSGRVIKIFFGMQGQV
ncbi:MAG: hypothetical protein AB1640_12870 [bacterium]